MKAYALTGVATALLASLMLLVSQLTTEQPAAPVSAAVPEARTPTAADARFFRELGANIDPGPQIEIALTDQQELIADSALRAVMDHYLFERGDAGRLPALRDYLRRTLPPSAARDAVQLADSYADYITAHDELLAAQNFQGTPDAVRYTSWQQQQHQLRVRMLGERVADEWFGGEEAYLAEALDETHQPQTSAPANEDDRRHRQYMQQVLQDAIGKAHAGQRVDAPPAPQD